MILRWKKAINERWFTLRLSIGLVILIVLLIALPHFFGYIEKKEGAVLNDWILNWLPAFNVSIPVFTLIWGMVLVTLVECFKQPTIFMKMLWGFIFLTVARMISISLLPLNPPENLIPLADPLSNYFYGESFITKDLFFSGHTSTQFLLFFVLPKPWQKKVALVTSILIGVMVMIQHVHYSIDVLGAFVFTPFIYWMSFRVSGRKK